MDLMCNFVLRWGSFALNQILRDLCIKSMLRGGLCNSPTFFFPNLSSVSSVFFFFFHNPQTSSSTTHKPEKSKNTKSKSDNQKPLNQTPESITQISKSSSYRHQIESTEKVRRRQRRQRRLGQNHGVLTAETGPKGDRGHIGHSTTTRWTA